jgi:hypothetical protein
MAPNELQTLFWDVNLADFDPACHPDYTIFRVLEFGDVEAVDWLERTFTKGEICRVLRTERRLTPKSANFWALMYGIPANEVAALQEHERQIA